MNFVIEFLPKQDKKSVVYVVRAANGFPLGVFDGLNEAVSFMSMKYDEMRKSPNGNA